MNPIRLPEKEEVETAVDCQASRLATRQLYVYYQRVIDYLEQRNHLPVVLTCSHARIKKTFAFLKDYVENCWRLSKPMISEIEKKLADYLLQFDKKRIDLRPCDWCNRGIHTHLFVHDKSEETSWSW